MQSRNIAACIINSSDPHLSQYVADNWKIRERISGFDGSAGTVVVLPEEAGLWTDSRYFLQAEMQLENSGILLFKNGLPDVPDYCSWIISNSKEGSIVGIDGRLFSTHKVEEMKEKFTAAGLALETDFVLTEALTDAHALTDGVTLSHPVSNTNTGVFIYDEKFAGISCSEKIKIIRQKIEEAKAGILLLTGLDEIAWTFNIRGNSVEYNPVTTAYATIATDSACIFIDDKELTPEVISYFGQNRIEILPYLSVFDFLSKLSPEQHILIDKQKVNYALFDAIPKSVSVVAKESPAGMLKAVKNETEIEGVRNAVIKDGVALIRAFYRLEKDLEAGVKVTESSFAEQLKICRAEQKDFFGESFPAITGYASHGAIVHYTATPESDAELRPDGLLLVDSGGNYFDGTTDITRTIALGKATKQQKTDYTNVLKGHIAIATAIFPEGTHGAQLDALARRPLWDNCLNYGHGTGHGVGHFLSVHEGPQNIRTKDNGVELKPGMLLSNEPGLYRKDEYGIRLENMILVKEYMETEFGRFFQFETLSLFPFDLQLIEQDMLSEKEIKWLNDYHVAVYEKLAPLLSEGEKKWVGRCPQL